MIIYDAVRNRSGGVVGRGNAPPGVSSVRPVVAAKPPQRVEQKVLRGPQALNGFHLTNGWRSDAAKHHRDACQVRSFTKRLPDANALHTHAMPTFEAEGFHHRSDGHSAAYSTHMAACQGGETL